MAEIKRLNDNEVREVAKMQRLITKYENVIAALYVLAKTGTETKLLKIEDSSLDREITYLWKWIKGKQGNEEIKGLI